MRRRAKRQLLVLCYHGVLPDSPRCDPYRARLAVDVGEFRSQLETLCRYFVPISAQDLILSIGQRAPLHDNAALITFDDGFQNNLDHAAPLLSAMGIDATFFVTTDLIGTKQLLWTQDLDERILNWTGNRIPMPGELGERSLPKQLLARVRLAECIRDHCKQMSNADRLKYIRGMRERSTLEVGDQEELYQFMDWDGVRKLDDYGFEIGSHTLDHPILARLDEDELNDQLQRSKNVIETQLATPCRMIAYPNGGPKDVSRKVYRATESAGYDAGFVLGDVRNSPHLDRLAIRRICVDRKLCGPAFEAAISGLTALWQSRREAFS